MIELPMPVAESDHVGLGCAKVSVAVSSSTTSTLAICS